MTCHHIDLSLWQLICKIQFSFESVVIVTDKFHIYRWMGLYRASDKMGSFMGRGKIAEYQIPGNFQTLLSIQEKI